ncbi:GcrA family cell cycle regulator [Pararhodospirillum photometricum]|uniref:GcrA family cell cycle regulator n=1 Tax=Pararhodospirillum photometricum TaxID=1084 RepID=UPI0009DB0534|nr:GcrA family cell cycle regulator [Pararhodospirillum photometricum]
MPSLFDLPAGACRWPIGHPGEPSFTFCGEPALPDKPYCAEHAARAYVVMPKPEPRHDHE